MSYLKSGLDSLSDWNGDMEGFHSSIQHFGFENLLRTDNLIPAFILREDAKMPVISLKYANGLRNGANSDTHRCKQLTEHGEERCIKLREVAGFSAVRTIFQIVGPRKILHCLLGK
jgi:hypothetical protein